MKIFNKESLIINIFGNVRKVIALLLTLVFCYLSISGTVTQEQFIPVFSMVLGYYFGKSTALDVPDKLRKKEDITNKEVSKVDKNIPY